MKRYLPIWFAMGWVFLGLTGCDRRGNLVSETRCSSAIAEVTNTWRVTYYTNRTHLNPNNVRVEEFGKTQLTNRNGEKPVNAASGPNEDGVWFPALPPEPTPEEIENQRQFGERYNPPELNRNVKFTLQCTVGDLAADGAIYRQAIVALRVSRNFRVSYSMGQVLQVLTPSAEEKTANKRNSAMPDQEPAEVGRPLPEPSSPVVYVDPVTGNDRAIGSESQPLKTITQALKTVQAGAIIQLRPGLYSAESDEVFPLQIKPGVTLRGDVQAQGRGIQITGGGKFLSPTWAGQSVVIVAGGDARIEGVSVTNPNTRGTGIWVEAGSPIIEHSTFIGNNREAIFVSGNAAPKIRSNVIDQNGGNGISFTRDSSGVADSNIIRNSGFGVSITERATPRLVKNQITQNKDGVVLSGETQPLLRYNTIENNTRDGIVITSTAEPTLKQNTFNGNGQYDVHNTTSKPVKVEETQLADLKVKGRVN